MYYEKQDRDIVWLATWVIIMRRRDIYHLCIIRTHAIDCALNIIVCVCVCVCVRARARERACVRARVRASVRASVRACVCACDRMSVFFGLLLASAAGF